MIDSKTFKLIEMCVDDILTYLEAVTRCEDRKLVWSATMEDNLLSELEFTGLETASRTMLYV